MATIYGKVWDNTIDAEDGVTNGSDVIYAGGGDDTIFGLGGDDFIWSGESIAAQNDKLYGGAGRDTAVYLDSVIGVIADLGLGRGYAGTAEGDRYTSIENLTGSFYRDILVGDGDFNILIGDLGDDALLGQGGDDVLMGGEGGDELAGSSGTDTASYVWALSGITASLDSGTGSSGDASGDTFESIENLTGSSFADTLTGDANANILDGGGGDDELKGGGGADTLDGGNGTDTAIYTDSASAVMVNLDSGLGLGGSAGGDTLREIENVSGSLHDDTLIGSADINRLFGSDGDDNLKGGGGADTLDGSSGVDTVSYVDSDARVTVDLLTGSGSGGTAEDDTLIDVENLTGSWHADTLTGDEGDNRLAGGGSDDWLKGGGGADTLDGGPGNDTATYLNYGTGVTVNLGSGTGWGGAAQGDVLIDIENLYGTVYADTLTGDSDANILRGDAGDDTLRGAGGADTLIGGNGADTLSGGSGADIFAWITIENAGTTVDTADTIAYFGFSEGDRISLAGIDADAYAAGNQAFSFIGTAAFTLDAATADPSDVTPGEIRYYHADGDTFIELQTGTSPDIEGLIRIAGIHDPEASWFVL